MYLGQFSMLDQVQCLKKRLENLIIVLKNGIVIKKKCVCVCAHCRN